ncbi:MAG: DnaB-like helicase N-terminal domain-containing protein [Armatimonadota bacterium]
MRQTPKLTTRRREQISLGAALREGSVPDPEEFHFPPHPEICQAMQAVRAAGDRIGLGTVSAWLKGHGQLDAVGGSLYLAELILRAGEGKG